MSRIKEFFELIRSKITSGSVSELGWVILGQSLNVLLGFVILKILSKMGTADYGSYALVLTISSLISLTYYGPLTQGFIRFYYDYLGRNAIRKYMVFVYRTTGVSGLIHLTFSLVVFLLSFFVNFGLTPAEVLLAGILILSLRVGELFSALLAVIRKRKENSLLQGCEKLLIVLLLYFLLQAGNLNLLWVFASFAFIPLLFAVLKASVLKHNVPAYNEQKNSTDDSVNKEIRNRVLTYILPFLIWGAAAWLQMSGEKWLIAGLLSTSDVGIYAVMISLITALIIFPINILSEFSTPIIFQNYADLKNAEKVNTGFSFIRINMFVVVLVTIFAVLITAFLGKEIIVLISLPEYSVYSGLLPFLCLGIGFYYMGQALSTLGMALNQPRIYLLPKILSGALSILLNYFLINYYGIAGTAYTAVIVGLFYLTYIEVVNQKMITLKESTL